MRTIAIYLCVWFLSSNLLQAQDKPVIPDAGKLGLTPQIESKKSGNYITWSVTYGKTQLKYFKSRVSDKSIVEVPKLGKGIKPEDHKFISRSSSNMPYQLATDGVVFIPGVGIAGYHSSFIPGVGEERDKRFYYVDWKYAHSGTIAWIIDDEGRMIIPANNEYVHAHGVQDGGMMAERVFYYYGNRQKYEEGIIHPKVGKKTEYNKMFRYNNEAPLPKNSGAYLFAGNVLEKEWKNLAELNDNRFYAKYIRYNYEGYTQLGEIQDEVLFITTLTPDLQIKSKYGPALSIMKESVFEKGKYNSTYGFNKAEQWKKTSIASESIRQPDGTTKTVKYVSEDEVFLLENHDIPGLFVVLTSSGEVYVPENSLGFIPFLSKFNFFGSAYMYNPVRDTLNIISGLIPVYREGDKILYNYISLNRYPSWNLVLKNETFNKPRFTDYEMLYSKTIGSDAASGRLDPFYSNPYTLMVRNMKDNVWYAVSFVTDKYPEGVWAGDTSLVSSILYTENKVVKINAFVAQKEYEKFLAGKEYERQLRESVRNSPEYQKRVAEHEQMAANIRQNTASARAAQRRAEDARLYKQKWEGFSYTKETSERYRQSVEQAVRSSPIPIKTTLEYKNGVIVRTY